MKVHQAADANNLFCNLLLYWHMHLQADCNIFSCYDSWTIAIFRLVESKQILGLSLPSLSLPSTSTKLFIQGVAWCIGFRIPACSILSMSMVLWDVLVLVCMTSAWEWCLDWLAYSRVVQENIQCHQILWGKLAGSASCLWWAWALSLINWMWCIPFWIHVWSFGT